MTTTTTTTTLLEHENARLRAELDDCRGELDAQVRAACSFWDAAAFWRARSMRHEEVLAAAGLLGGGEGRAAARPAPVEIEMEMEEDDDDPVEEWEFIPCEEDADRLPTP